MIGKKPGLGPDNGEATSVIGEGSVFEGEFKVTGNLRVDGTFSGKLNISETLVVGKNGSVDAEVKVRCAVIAGTIKGDLNASEKITLQSGSRLEGEMVTSKLVIEEGVSFQGSCNTSSMSGPGKGQSAPAKSPQKQDDKQHNSDDAKALQEKIEEVAEELAKK
ncbi:polymer-forming cytoskeletal protein [bacterium]|nr:polymer-forming cytoskeletal protein [bacterium]